MPKQVDAELIRHTYGRMVQKSGIFFPYPTSTGGSLFSVSDLIRPDSTFSAMGVDELDFRPDISLWWESRTHPLDDDELHQALRYAAMDDPVKIVQLSRRNIHPEQAAAFALASIVNSHRQSPISPDRLQPLEELAEHKTISPVYNAFNQLMAKKDFDVFANFAEVAEWEPSALQELRKDILNNPIANRLVESLGGLSVAVIAVGLWAPQYLPVICGITLFPLSVAGAGIALAHLVKAGYSETEINRMMQNLVILNELTKDNIVSEDSFSI